VAQAPPCNQGEVKEEEGGKDLKDNEDGDKQNGGSPEVQEQERKRDTLIQRYIVNLFHKLCLFVH